MEKQWKFMWSDETYRLWSTPRNEREEFHGTVLECMEEANSQCMDVTFRLRYANGAWDAVLVLVKGIQSGMISPIY